MSDDKLARREVTSIPASVAELIRAVANRTPVLGVFTDIVSGLRARRAERELAYQLRRLERRDEALLRRLLESDDLLERVTQILNVAALTTDEEKLNLLRNAALNAVVMTFEDQEDALFVHLLEGVLPIHVRVLSELRNTERMPTGFQALLAAFTRVFGRRVDLVPASFSWLSSQGLVEITPPAQVQESAGTIGGGPQHYRPRPDDKGTVRITPLGLRFLAFLSDGESGVESSP